MLPTVLVLLAGLAPADPPDIPRLGEWPAVRPAIPPPVKSDEPRPLSADRLRLFWVEQYLGNVPLRWSATPLDPTAALDLIELPACAPAIGILEGESRAKAHFAPKEVKDAVAVWGVSPGRVLLQADGVQDGRIVTLVRVIVAVGGTAPKPPPPPVATPTSLYFLIIRPTGPASADFAAILANPAWEELRKAGHAVKDKTLGELGDLYRVPPGTTLPCVVTLKVASDGRASVARGPVNLPVSSDAIRLLAEVRP